MPIVPVHDFIKTTFDYVIVGGGTAGLAVAARLSEDPSVVVGVIEAGGYHDSAPEANVPGFAGRAMANPDFDWTFFSVPQKHANGRPVFQPRGKGLGGSSMLNLLASSRPSKADIDALESLGNKGWNWDTLLPYFKRSETCVPLDDQNLSRSLGIDLNPDVHGNNGPIVKSFASWYSPLHHPMREAFESLGVSVNGEPAGGINVGYNTGFGSVDPSTATRSYSVSGYYKPNASRKNFVVLTNAQVSKVILEPTPDGLQRAAGVDILQSGKTFSLRGIRKEVVVSAGTMQTPAVLELSGIGNSNVLEKCGIPTLIDLPGVGENFQDHPISFIIVEVDSKLDSLDILKEPARLAEQEELYKEKKGIIASMACQQFAYISAPTLLDPDTIKQWQSQVANTSLTGLPSLKRQYEAIRSWMADPDEAYIELLGLPGHFFTPLSVAAPGKRYYSFVVSVMHPLSRGSVHISSPNPADTPVIDPNYLDHPVDLEMLTSGIDFALKLFDAESTKQATVGHVMPSQEVCQQGNDALKAYVKDTIGCSFHPLGTASMLPRADGGVVDENLKVYGTSNLRVIDCSILPLEVSSHTQSTVYAIAEKGADILKRCA